MRWVLVLVVCIISSLPTPSWANDDLLKTEIKIGRNIASIIVGIYGLYPSEKVNHYVSLVGNSVAYLNGRTDIRYYFSVLNSDEINALACPGGYIFITKGLLKQLENEAQLAAILAHEISHVNRRHVLRALNIKPKDKSGSIFSRFLQSRHSTVSVAFSQTVSKGVSILLQSGLQHQDEYEADQGAIFYCSQVGYDPFEYIKVLNKIQNKQSGFSVTHPKMSNRVNKIQQSLQFYSPKNTKKLKGRYQKNV